MSDGTYRGKGDAEESYSCLVNQRLLPEFTAMLKAMIKADWLTRAPRFQ